MIDLCTHPTDEQKELFSRFRKQDEFTPEQAARLSFGVDPGVKPEPDLQHPIGMLAFDLTRWGQNRRYRRSQPGTVGTAADLTLSREELLLFFGGEKPAFLSSLPDGMNHKERRSLYIIIAGLLHAAEIDPGSRNLKALYTNTFFNNAPKKHTQKRVRCNSSLSSSSVPSCGVL